MKGIMGMKELSLSEIKEVNKPESSPMSFYKLSESICYIQKKYRCSMGKFAGFDTSHCMRLCEESEDRNFFNFLKRSLKFKNGTFSMLSEYDKKRNELEDKDWRSLIIDKIMDDLGTGDPGKRYVVFWVDCL